MPIDKAPGPDVRIRIIRFLVVGGAAAGIQLASLQLWRKFFEPKTAVSLSFVCATATHYSLNRFWALPSFRRDSGRQLSEYLGTVGMSYIINLGMFSIWHDAFGMGVFWATAFAIPPSTIVVFLLLNYRVFRRSSGESART
jgi:putative flippase GtrA